MREIEMTTQHLINGFDIEQVQILIKNFVYTSFQELLPMCRTIVWPKWAKKYGDTQS
jgi:hypothetical protein